jgi:hypothetical protein
MMHLCFVALIMRVATISLVILFPVMLPLRCLEGRMPRSTHCRMRRLHKKTKSTPTRLAPLPPLPLPRSSSSAASFLPTLGALNACISGGPLPHPSELHGAGVSSTRLRRDSYRWCGGAAGGWAALHRGVTPFLAPATELPPPQRPWRSSPTIPHRRRQAKTGTGGGGALAPSLATGSDPDGWNRPAQASAPLCCKCMFQVF